MSILQSFENNVGPFSEHVSADDRAHRNCLDDVKHGFDLVFELKDKLDKLHPAASEIIYRVIRY